MIKIAFDGRGGEHVRDASHLALQEFLSEYEDVHVYMATSQSRFEVLLGKLEKKLHDKLFLLESKETIKFHESPIKALKKKAEASIVVATQAVLDEGCDALLSFGHTGATVAAAQLKLGLIKGVHRAGLATIMPNRKGFGLLMDVGANLNCKPEHLYQYAVMADIYAKSVFELKSPKIGLLNIGEESGKGDKFLNKTYQLFEEGDINFVGNVEGGQIFDGSVDCIICNGITGNMLLKSSESLAQMLFQDVQEKLSRKLNAEKEKKQIAESLLQEIAESYNPDSRGASRLLGVNGRVLIGHGNAGVSAIYNGLCNAYRESTLGLQSVFEQRLAPS